MKKGILGLVKKVGYTVVKEQPNEKKYPDIEKEFWPLFDACKPYTMSSVERLYSLYKSLDYIIQNNIPGDFVECGVWRGGVPMFIAKVLMKHKLTFRKIYLYDTYEGMPPPTTNDVDYKGRNADVLMDLHDGDKKAVDSVWCYSPYDEVASNMRSTGYPTETTSRPLGVAFATRSFSRASTSIVIEFVSDAVGGPVTIRVVSANP